MGHQRSLCASDGEVRSYPDNGRTHARPNTSVQGQLPTHALQQTKWVRRSYSIASSARLSSSGGTVSPSSFAVLRLITSSSLVGSSTGRSSGFAPFKIL